MKRTVFAYPYIVWMLIFIFSPMLLIVYYAFTMNGVFTLQSLRGALDPLYLAVLLRSVWMAFRATALCLLLGYPIAYLLSRMQRSKATLLSVLFVVPMWMNFLLRTYAWQVLLDVNGILNGLLSLAGLPSQQFLYTAGAVMLGMVYNFLPFMVLPIHTVLVKMDASHIEAAQDLGRTACIRSSAWYCRFPCPADFRHYHGVLPAITTFAIPVCWAAASS
jgi:spermidine/putrescine transport system permease protein